MASQKGLLLSSGKHFYMCYDLEVHFSIGKKLKEDMRLNWKLPIGHSLLLKELSEKTATNTPVAHMSENRSTCLEAEGQKQQSLKKRWGRRAV